MTETLTCESCSKDWTRDRKRGRKPRECPDCVGRTTIVSKHRRAKVDAGPTPAQAAADRREFLKPEREIETKLPSDDPEYAATYLSWWCLNKIPMHKTCASINNDACICWCHKEKKDA